MSDPTKQLYCRDGHAMPRGADWCQSCGEPPIKAVDIECPTCGAWKGWACEGPNYGYHAAGYHPARHKAVKTIKHLPTLSTKEHAP